MNFRIQIKVTHDETGNVIGIANGESVEIAEQILASVPKWIETYKRNHYADCFQCGREHYKDDMSQPQSAGDEYDDVLFCQDCVEAIMAGEMELKIID